MIGYCFLNAEGILGFRTKEFIETDMPNFWQDNINFILSVWRFDTEDLSSMYQMYARFRELKLKSSDVLDFSKSINFDIKSLKGYRSDADSIQSN